MPLIRLIYTSESALTAGGARVLVHYNDIVTTARRHNALNGITGFLMFDRERFHQILEGEAGAVDSLYAAIERDLRHTNVTLLSRVPIDKPGFPDWSMGSFLNEGRPHPLQLKHGIQPRHAVDGERFLRFALDFAAADPSAA